MRTSNPYFIICKYITQLVSFLAPYFGYIFWLLSNMQMSKRWIYFAIINHGQTFSVKTLNVYWRLRQTGSFHYLLFFRFISRAFMLLKDLCWQAEEVCNNLRGNELKLRLNKYGGDISATNIFKINTFLYNWILPSRLIFVIMLSRSLVVFWILILESLDRLLETWSKTFRFPSIYTQKKYFAGTLTAAMHRFQDASIPFFFSFRLMVRKLRKILWFPTLSWQRRFWTAVAKMLKWYFFFKQKTVAFTSRRVCSLQFFLESFRREHKSFSRTVIFPVWPPI